MAGMLANTVIADSQEIVLEDELPSHARLCYAQQNFSGPSVDPVAIYAFMMNRDHSSKDEGNEQ